MMKNCPACGISLTSRERDTGVCDICGASLKNASTAPVGFSRSDPTPSSSGIRHGYTLHQSMKWDTVRTGLLLAAVGTSMILVAAITFTVMAQLQPHRNALTQGLVLILGVSAVWSAGMLLTAPFLATAAPEESGANGWAIGACVCLIMGILLFVINSVMDSRVTESVSDVSPREVSLVIFYLGQVVTVLGGVCWWLFVRRIAVYFDRPGLGMAAVILLIAGVINHIVLNVWLLEGVALDPAPLPIWALLLDAVVFGVWSVVILCGTRAAMTHALAKR